MIKILIDIKIFHYVNRFADDGRMRFNLAGVRFEKNLDVVATDGHKMGIMHNGFEIVEWDDEEHSGFTVITKYEKEVKKSVKLLSGKIEIVAEFKEGRFEITLKDEKGITLRLEGCDQYPDYMKVVPERTDKTESNHIKFNPKFLMDFAGYEKEDRITLEIHNDREPMLVFNSKLSDFVGVLMPCC